MLTDWAWFSRDHGAKPGRRGRSLSGWFRRGQALILTWLIFSCLVLACQGARPETGALPGRFALNRVGELGLVDTSTGTVNWLKPDGQGRGDIIDPVWSPDGRELTFVHQTAPAPGDPIPLGRASIRAFDPATGQTRIIHEEPVGSLLYRPVWAADGQSLVFNRVEHKFDGLKYLGFEESVVRISRHGGSPDLMAAHAALPALSPDNRTLIFLSREGTPREPGVWKRDLAGGQETLLLATPFPIEINGLAFSPDGQTVAYSASGQASGADWSTGRAWWEPSSAFAHGLPADLWLMAPDGTNRRQITRLGEDRLLPSWSPDGQSIAALGLNALYVFNLDGTERARWKQLGGEGMVAWGKSPG